MSESLGSQQFEEKIGNLEEELRSVALKLREEIKAKSEQIAENMK